MNTRFHIVARCLGILLFVICASATCSAVAEGQVLTREPANWIVPARYARLRPIDIPASGEDSRWLLIDHQVNALTNGSFFHSVRQIFTPAGVNKSSTLRTEFKPVRENIVFHWVRIVRGTNVLNHLDPSKIKVIQPERNLDEDLFSGDHEAVLFLEDVRPGDIIDYAYTLEDLEPSNRGKLATAMNFAYGEAVEEVYLRLLWPVQRRLYTKDHGIVPKPVVARRGTTAFEYKWDAKKVPAFHMEDNTPVWYHPRPWLQLSEFSSWSEVNLWAQNIFRYTNALAPELLQRAAEWKKLPNKEAKVLAALQFVQEEVRYLGIETPGNEYRPANPSEVFARRFGDCKDKALLFVTLLRVMQIEAWPVLVNTQERRGLDNWQPTFDAFNHAIAMVMLEGQAQWFDCTAMSQRGPLAGRAIRDYERGLVIRPGTTALTAIPEPDDTGLTTVTEYFDIGGMNVPAALKIITVIEGPDADRWRAEFSGKPREDIQKYWVNIYARLYPDIKISDPLTLVDDEKLNRIEMTEFYSIDNFWVRRTPTDPYYGDFDAENLRNLVVRPFVNFRTMPLAVRYPCHEIFRIRANTLNTGWIFSETKNVEDPAFTFRRTMNINQRALNMDCEFHTLKDAVPVGTVRTYLQHLDQAWQYMGYRLTPL